ncbi:putative very-long-chain enoyl-CoA reductase art-1 [Halotydeus destructor]|nr:putative very-long-chain enoyl-CoA reductase art-1 [Halotydeus destructor]
MELEILKAGSESAICSLANVAPSSKISEVKKLISKQRKALYPDRQSLRLESKGKALNDDQLLSSLDLRKGKILYLKDLGPQIGWKTVFLWEYFGPLVCYLVFYLRPTIVYGNAASRPIHETVHIAAACWSLHYVKRLLETLFIHRFSHGTMPILNLFKNCSYYWGFAAFIGYFVNHPLYTAPYFGKLQIYGGLVAFLLSELGNYSIMSPCLFNYVSCPNYSYEVYSWAAFTIMTQSLPVALFASAGFAQMALWALGKHKNYKKEFSNYPKRRKAIIPFLI